MNNEDGQYASREVPKTSNERPPELQDEKDEEREFIYSDIERPNTDAAPAPEESKDPMICYKRSPMHAVQPEVFPIPATPLRRSG